MNSPFKIFTTILLPIITFLFGLTLATNPNVKHSLSDSLGVDLTERTDTRFQLVDEVTDLINQKYVEDATLDDEVIERGAAAGVVRQLNDPYSLLLTPEEKQDFDDSLGGKLQGIGAELTFRDGLVVVVSPLKGSPALDAGLLPEDIITAVDGRDVEGESLFDVVKQIRGPAGTQVELTIYRIGREPFIIPIIRADIDIPSVESMIITRDEQRIAHLALNRFGADSVDELRKALANLSPNELDGIILDVRNNGGGFLEAANQLTSLFLQQGKIVTVKRRGNEEEIHFVDGSTMAPSTPLVVLINGGSASASEIVAGALQDHGRATIVGQQSFGKGTVQEVVPLTDGSSLHLTIAKWYTPLDRSISEGGITPDIKIEPLTAEEVAAFVDEEGNAPEETPDVQLNKAIEVLLK